MSALPIQEARLANGLLVLTCPMRGAPVVSVYVWYRVGGCDDPAGRTGLSHWLEHMLYKATRLFPAGEIPRLLASHGGQWNGFTWYDYTTYFATLPRDALDVALRIEADRMANAELDPVAVERERVVVQAEIAGNAHASTQGLRERALASVFGPRAYGRPLAGTPEDLESVTHSDLLQHYRTWYRPDNAVLVIAGDLDSDRVQDHVAERFAHIASAQPPKRTPDGEPLHPGQQRVVPRGPGGDQRVAASGPGDDQRVVAGGPGGERCVVVGRPGERRVVVRGAGVAAALQVCYPIPAASHADFLPLTVAAAALGSGRHSRLHTALVPAGLASRVEATATMARGPYVLSLEVATTRDADPERVEQNVLAQVESLAASAASEVAHVKRRLRHAFVLGSEGASNHARLIGRHEMADSFHRFETYLEDLERITAEDVHGVVRRHLAPDRPVVGWFLPDLTLPMNGTNGTPAVDHLHP